nr:MAG TPA: hypothetical protein [Caudoviricetes sp.]
MPLCFNVVIYYINYIQMSRYFLNLIKKLS